MPSWKRRFVVVVVGMLALVGLGAGLVVADDMRFHHRRLGMWVLWPPDVDRYEGERHFNGDGYSHVRRQLPVRVCDAVRGDSAVLSGRPVWPVADARSLLIDERQTWVATPLDADALRGLDGMHLGQGVFGAPATQRDRDAGLEAVLSRPGSLVAWRTRRLVTERGSHVTNLELLVLELAPCQLWWVAHDT